MDFETMKKIVDGAPEWANKFNPETKVYSKTVNVFFLGASYATHVVYSQAGFLGGLIDLNDLRAELAKREPMDLRAVDIPHGTIVLELKNDKPRN